MPRSTRFPSGSGAKGGLEDIACSTFPIQYLLSPLFFLRNSDDAPSNALTFPLPLANQRLCVVPRRSDPADHTALRISRFFDAGIVGMFVVQTVERNLLLPLFAETIVDGLSVSLLRVCPV